MPHSEDKAIVLLSGGLDSTVALAETLAVRPVARALTFDYGQRAATREIAAARAISAHYGAPLQVIELPWLTDLLPGAMKGGGASAATESATGDGLLSQREPHDVRQVWVPNRNGLFLNIAASFAEALGASTVVFGANMEEGADFPDNTPAFRDRLNAVLALSTLSGVRVETPVGQLSKTEILLRGQALGVPLHLIWSCYGGQQEQCGQCASCVRVKEAQARLRDLEPRSAPAIRFRNG